MIHQFRDKKQIARKKYVYKIIIICIIFILLFVLGVVAWSGSFFASIGRPLWRGQNSIVEGIKNVGSGFSSKIQLYESNEKLQQKNIDLNALMLDYTVVKNENNQLKELLGRQPETKSFVLAAILTRPNRSPYDTIIIDGGSNVGITEGSRVYANMTIPIGEVHKVHDTTSIVMLFSNPGQITEGILDPSNATVELIGRGGGNFEMTIPVDLVSESGSSVVFPGIHSEIIAIIDAIISQPSDPVKKVLLHSPVNIQNLKWVQVKR